MMLGRRVELLKQKLQDVEKEHQERLTAGGGNGGDKEAHIFLVLVVGTCACTALDRQKASLEEVAERTLDWRLRDKEREMQQELSYRVSEYYGRCTTCTFVTLALNIQCIALCFCV